MKFNKVSKVIRGPCNAKQVIRILICLAANMLHSKVSTAYSLSPFL